MIKYSSNYKRNQAMLATRIRPVSDLRNKYPEVESEIEKGPVYLTKNGYGSSVIVSTAFFDETLAKLALYEKIATSERQIAAGLGKNARASLAAIREKYHV